MDSHRLWWSFWGAICLAFSLQGSEASSPWEEPASPRGGGASRQYALYQWTAANGLPVSTIQCLLQTRDGYLWIGTRNGLVRFDGERFVLVRDLNCLSVAEDNDGALWMGGTWGLFRLKGGAIEEVVLPERSPPTGYDHAVFAMCPCPDGGIWLGCGQGLFRAAGTNLLKLADDPHLGFIKSLRLGRSGQLLLATDQGLWSWTLPATGSSRLRALLSSYDVRCAAEDRSGSIWFGEFATVLCLRGGLPIDGVAAADDQRTPLAAAPSTANAQQLPRWDVKEYHSETTESPDRVYAIAQDARGMIWLGTATGLWQIRGDVMARPLEVDGARFGLISCLLVDREGNLFLGTDKQGLYCLERKRFTTYTTANGPANDDVWSVASSQDGSIWLGTDGGLSRLVQGHWHNYGTKDGLVTERVRSVLEDGSGTLWVGTDTTGQGATGALHRLQHGSFVPFHATDGIASGDFSSICDDGRGSVWIVGGAGVHQWTQGVLRTWSAQDGFQRAPRWAFADRAGGIWIGGDSLDCLWNGHLAHYDLNRLLGPGVCGVVHEDENGALWLGSSDHGLVRFKEGRFQAITKAQGLFSDLVMSLQEDDAGNYWMNCHAGIFRARKQDLNAVADGRRSFLQCVAYGLEDGLLSVEANGGTLPNSCKTPDGRLWFPTTKGVAVVDPVDTRTDALALPVVIESVQADGETLYQNVPPTREIETTGGAGMLDAPKDAGGRRPSSREKAPTLRLLPGRGHSLRVEFAAPSPISSSRIRFRYRLVGRDHYWTDLGTERFVVFHNLPPGRYLLSITACNRHGVWSETGDQLAFAFEPFFYQTWTFYGLCGGVLVLGIAAFELYRHSMQKRILTLQKDAALAEERERIARDLHDDLGASLSRIALLSEVAQKELGGQPAATQIGHISGIASQVVDSIGELVWATNPKYDNLESLTAYLRQYGAQCFESSGIECRLSFPTALPPHPLTSDFRRQLFMVFREALCNVSKHSGANRVEISLALAPGYLELVIQDNGKGMVAQEAPQFHHGLSNMRERVALLRGAFELHSTPGQGTRVGIRVPLPGI